jgi:ankyrin repeat protein
MQKLQRLFLLSLLCGVGSSYGMNEPLSRMPYPIMPPASPRAIQLKACDAGKSIVHTHASAEATAHTSGKKVQSSSLLCQGFVGYGKTSAHTVKKLFRAIRDDKLPRMRKIIKESPGVIDAFESYADVAEKLSALHVAALDGSSASVELLLHYRADPNALTFNHHSALHYVRSPKSAQLLVNAKGNVDQQDCFGQTPLFYVLIKPPLRLLRNEYHTSTNIGQVLLDAGAQINKEDDEKSSPLHQAVTHARLKAVAFLLHNGADGMQWNAHKQSPFDLVMALDSSLFNEHTSRMIQLFEAHGMVVFPHYKQITHDLLLALKAMVDDWNDCWEKREKDSDVFKAVINTFGKLLTFQNRGPSKRSGKCSSVCKLAFKGNDYIFDRPEELLGITLSYIEHDLLLECERAETMIAGGRADLLKQHITDFPFIIMYDAQIAQNMVRQSIQNNHTECLKILLENGIAYHALPYTTNDKGGNWLHCAVACDNPQAIELLVEYDADFSCRNADGKTPVQCALESEKIACIEAFDRALCKYLIRTLHCSTDEQWAEVICQITNVNVRLSSQQGTVLHAVCCAGIDNKVSLLVAAGADATTADINGSTPLECYLNRVLKS